jgi:hypothetical protein
MASFKKRSAIDQVRELSRLPDFASSFFVTVWKTRIGWWTIHHPEDPLEILKAFDEATKQSASSKKGRGLWLRIGQWSALLTGISFFTLTFIPYGFSKAMFACGFVLCSAILATTVSLLKLGQHQADPHHLADEKATHLRHFLRWLDEVARLLMLGENYNATVLLSLDHLKALSNTAVQLRVEQAHMRAQEVRMLDQRSVDLKVLGEKVQLATTATAKAENSFQKLKELGLIDREYGSYWQSAKDSPKV